MNDSHLLHLAYLVDEMIGRNKETPSEVLTEGQMRGLLWVLQAEIGKRPGLAEIYHQEKIN